MAGLGFASLLTLVAVPVLHDSYFRLERTADAISVVGAEAQPV